MTCKDCLYSPICKVHADFGVTDVPYDENDTCEMFKNKADLVEVKHGEWITPTKIKSMTIAVPHCSVCGLVPCDKGLYCPNCGEKMDLKEGAEND